MKTKHFRDFDDFSASVRDVEATMMLPKNPKHCVWSISQTYLPKVHLQLGRLGSGNIVEGESWSSGYVLYLPLTPRCGYVGNGTTLPQDSFLILEPGCDFCISTKEEHDWCSVFVPSRELNRCDDVEERTPATEGMTCRVARTKSHLVKKFRTLFNQVMMAAASCPQFESSQAANFAEADLLKVCSSVLGRRTGRARVRERDLRIPRPEIIRRSKVWLERHEGKRVRIEELAAAAEVSERTLRTAFNEYFGVGPTRYLQLRQLHQVRSALKAADRAASSVSDLLIQHGEWEFGRFAARYRRLFGERPSETLARKQR